jgi:GGDEF domain-containing protein
MDIIFVAAVALLTLIGWCAPQAQILTGTTTIVVVGAYAVLAYSERTQLLSQLTVDRVSGFLNERAARACIERECDLSDRGNHSLCVVTINLKASGSSLPSDSAIAERIAQLTTRAEVLVRYGNRKFAIVLRDREPLEVTEILVGVKVGLSDPRLSAIHTGLDHFKLAISVEPIFYRRGESSEAFLRSVYQRFENTPNKIDMRA